MGRARHLWVLAHRWSGLALAFFLIVCGATGAVLPFYHELDRVAARAFHAASDGPALDPLVLRARAEALSGARVPHLPLHVPAGEAAVFSIEPRPGGPAPGFDEIALDPATGRELGRRSWGAIGEGWVNLMPFLYKLHYSLALDDWGAWILGVAALVWTIDCFVGFALTLPLAAIAGWWARWRKAWTFRTSPRAKAEYDLHRAGGLWLWPVLLLFAWSGVGFNLNTVFSPVMKAAVGDAKSGYVAQPPLAQPLDGPPLDWPAALAQARRLTAREAQARGFTVGQETFMRYDRVSGVYYYAFRSDRDVYERFAGARLAFDARDGTLRYLSLPTGAHPRTTIETWLFGLHMAAIGGLPVRIAVSLVGLAVVGLSVTGVFIWMRKRRARLISTARRGARATLPHFEPTLQPAE
jgi:uncharacterized iron-regulated membrane protein